PLGALYVPWSLIGYSLIFRQKTYLFIRDIQFSAELGLMNLALIDQLSRNRSNRYADLSG
ncbi:MAG: hypothetical protein ABR985_18490, partial [Methanotrichaceae archaeon]